MKFAPLVSAIMPTRGRTEMASAAVRMFTAQNWANKELVIVDDELEPSFQTAPSGTTYSRTSCWMTIGEKRNRAIAMSRGQVVIHWDSDDLYKPDRISAQVALLMANREAELAGYHSMEFIDEELKERYLYNAGPGHAIGVSMCYWRAAWEHCPFRHIDEAEDAWFAHGRRIVSAAADGRIVARIHTGNSVDKRLSIQRNPIQWKPLPWDKTAAA